MKRKSRMNNKWILGVVMTVSTILFFPVPVYSDGIKADVDVYMGGYAVKQEKDTDIYVTGYWINGKWNAVDKPAHAVKGDMNISAMTVDGKDVYLWGTADGISGYWKNGKWTSVGGAFDVTSMFVAGNNIYVAGARNDMPIYMNVSEKKVANLAMPPKKGKATSIFISGKDIYVAGNLTNGKNEIDFDFQQEVGYWKNGKWTVLKLPRGREFESPDKLSMFIANNKDIYIAGTALLVDECSPPFGGYWKNGKWTEPEVGGPMLPDNLTIFVSGANEYFGGTSMVPGEAVPFFNFTKNKKEMEMSGPEIPGGFSSVYVKQVTLKDKSQKK